MKVARITVIVRRITILIFCLYVRTVFFLPVFLNFFFFKKLYFPRPVPVALYAFLVTLNALHCPRVQFLFFLRFFRAKLLVF